ncbi:hypothetical protein I317_00684 [Kwoniella heveanensis CBS 569]|nr:hypothetical protein I317_00684 [Kwoniella heveanensis CBS 569]
MSADSYTFVVSGYRDTYTIFSFDPSTAQIKVVSDSKAPEKASWIEAAPNAGGLASSRNLYSISEVEKGLAVSLKLSSGNDKIEITAQRETGGSPAHVHVMKDGSGLVAGNYLGGSVIFYPFNADGSLSTTSESPILHLPFVYKDQESPNPERQDASHAHQVLEGENGIIYVPDLGSDRVWVIEREGESGLKIKGWLQAPPGTGPRHAVISKDGKHMYVLTELTSDVLVFSLDTPTYPIIPKPDFKVNIVPDEVSAEAHKFINASELVANPAHPQVLYASNRLELHLEENSKGQFKAPEGATGDAIAIIELDESGDKVKSVKKIRTALDNLRGMAISADGKYVATAGRKKGGLEIWRTGDNGLDFKLAAKDEKVEGVTDLLFL